MCLKEKWLIPTVKLHIEDKNGNLVLESLDDAQDSADGEANKGNSDSTISDERNLDDSGSLQQDVVVEGVVDKAGEDGSVADVDIGVVDAHQYTVVGEDQNFESPKNVNETFIQEDTEDDGHH
jgi:hypothetical protein